MKTGKGPSWFFRSVFLLLIAGSCIGAIGGGVVYFIFARDLPNLITVEDYRPATVTQIVAKGNEGDQVIGEFFKERRYLTSYEQIPPLVVQAFISAEDDKFFEHQGINLGSIIRAAIANFRAGHVVQGGSTITQQVAKSLLLTPERSYTRKLKELILAYQIERNLTKEQILYLYLNQIYLGHGAYGVEAASRVYYGKSVADLTIPEAAMIAGMPQAPGKFSPHLNPQRAKERQLYVLRRMYENRYISEEEYRISSAEPLKIYFDHDLNKKFAAHLVEHLRRYLLDAYGEKLLYEEGLKIHVPMKVAHALAARTSLREGLRSADKRYGYRGPIAAHKSDEEIQNAIKKTHEALIRKTLGYRVLTSEGTLEFEGAIAASGVESPEEILKPGSIHQAVVTDVDDKKNQAKVNVGEFIATLSLEEMKWAKPARDDKNPSLYRPEPRRPSDVVKRGHEILVRILKKGDAGIEVGLEQEPQVEGALFSIDTQTGDVLAMQGGYDFEKSEFNRAIQAQRQPGSAFKPIIFAAGIEKGYTPASIIVDSPITYEDEETGKWKPTNFEEKFYGDTTFRQALIKSRNVPTIKLVQAIQVPNLIQYARRIGMTGHLNDDLSISLGSGSTSLFELTKVYALFPRLGRKVEPVFYSQIVDRDGKVLEDRTPAVTPHPEASPLTQRDTANEQKEALPPPSEELTADGRPAVIFPSYPRPEDPDQVMDPRVAYVMSHLMQEVVEFGTGGGARSLGRGAAGKTGTTNDYLDAWFMGFTPNVVTGVWVGNDNLKSLGPGETGGRTALPIWLGYMEKVVKDYPHTDLPIPNGVVFANIHPTTGKLAPPNSSQSIKEAFIEGTEPLLESTERRGMPQAPSASEFLKEDIE